jgi:hypothetical protein
MRVVETRGSFGMVSRVALPSHAPVRGSRGSYFSPAGEGETNRGATGPAWTACTVLRTQFILPVVSEYFDAKPKWSVSKRRRLGDGPRDDVSMAAHHCRAIQPQRRRPLPPPSPASIIAFPAGGSA